RLTALPGATPRTGKSRRRVEDDGGSWVRDGRPTPLTIISALLAVAVVAGAAWIFLTGDSAETPVAASTGGASSPATRAPAGPSAVPQGYERHTGPGFSAAAPGGWKLATSGGVATFSGPKDSGMRILVEQSTPHADGGLSELSRLEADGGMESYIQVQLQAVDYRGWQAADWEYTYTTAAGVPMHALVRYVTIDEKAGFRITFDLPELKWDEQADTRTTFLGTFRQST
ncbi:hypothetical protein, partial [Nonomuraea sp. MG754425]|uniref:hypothetical protein n=1 Tax=Nonomuraea sp. MG754425 TaxID=2570319 RepID=UPI001F31C808